MTSSVSNTVRIRVSVYHLEATRTSAHGPGQLSLAPLT